jgi:hypothetical protein
MITEDEKRAFIKRANPILFSLAHRKMPSLTSGWILNKKCVLCGEVEIFTRMYSGRFVHKLYDHMVMHLEEYNLMVML